MSEERQGARRVLVALQVGPPARDLLAAAAILARGPAAEILGLFVEDEDLHRVAALPVARVVGYPSAAVRDVDAAAMERALRAAAEQAAAEVRAAAERNNLRSSFRVRRGRVAAEVVAASADADLVLLGRGAHPAAWSGLGPTTARVVADRARRPVVLVAEGKPLGAPAVVYDASPAGERSLAAAALMARATGGPVIVLAAGDTTESAQRAADLATAWLEARGLPSRTRLVPRPTTATVLRALLASGAGALVVDGAWPGSADALERLLDEVPLPVMIAR